MMDAIAAFYEGYDEAGRLERDNFHRIEFLTSMRYLEAALLPGSRILDACAGAGAYAFALARQGHRVTACDLMPAHVGQMREADRRTGLLEDIRACNVLDLSAFGNAAFDAVLCMGALYHLFTADERRRAVEECLRVLRPGGLFAAAFINRHAQLILSLLRDGMEKYDTALECIQTGSFDAADGGAVFYRSTPREMAALMTGCGLEPLHMVGADGIGHLAAGLLNGMDDADFSRWLGYHHSACEDESLLGYSLHGLYIGRKAL